jgi:hypothetical protein
VKANPPRVRTCVGKKNSPVVKEQSYFAPTTKQGSGPAEALSFRDGGAAPRCKVPGRIGLDSDRTFPGEVEKVISKKCVSAGGEDKGYFAY